MPTLPITAFIGLVIGYMVVLWTGFKLMGKYHDAMIRIKELEAAPRTVIADPALSGDANWDGVGMVIAIGDWVPQAGQDLAPAHIPTLWINPNTQQSHRRRYDGMPGSRSVWDDTSLTGRNETNHLSAILQGDFFVRCSAVHSPGVVEAFNFITQMDVSSVAHQRQFRQILDTLHPEVVATMRAQSWDDARPEAAQQVMGVSLPIFDPFTDHRRPLALDNESEPS